MHEAAFAAAGREARYLACDVQPAQLETALAGMRALGFAGANVTVPHKEAACRWADRRLPAAAATGSANTLAFRPEGVWADSTDGRGLLAALEEEIGWRAASRRVLVLGAGGAARSVVAALLQAGAAEVAVLNRTPQRAAELVADLRALGPLWAVPFPLEPAPHGLPLWAASAEGAALLARTDLLLNTTTLGMHGQGSPVPAEALDCLPEAAVVCDIVYVPRQTPLLAAARQRGHPVVGGLGMLVWQAALAWELWFGVRGPAPVMRQAAERALAVRGV